VFAPCSCGLVAVTVTPGSTAPCASTTVPTNRLVVCAETGDANAKSAATVAQQSALRTESLTKFHFMWSDPPATVE
jgi:hypothetical protein